MKDTGLFLKFICSLIFGCIILGGSSLAEADDSIRYMILNGESIDYVLMKIIFSNKELTKTIIYHNVNELCIAFKAKRVNL